VLKQITEWNTVKKIWTIGEADLFSQLYRPFSDRWPISGMMRNGQVYELPIQAQPITDSESLLSPSLLPTPLVDDAKNTGHNKKRIATLASETYDLGNNPLFTTPIASEGLKASAAQSSAERAKTGQVFLTNEAHDLALENDLPVPPRLLPTPISSDSKGTGPADANRVTVQLRAINHLLPTVTTQESKTGPSQLNRNTPPLNAMIPEMHKEGINWGKYEPAVRRWEEVLGRKAPAPTNPDGKEGAHRLAAEFVEWMMGLPEGWVTDPELGLKRNDQLKALGNGVVPQQAKYALQLLLDDELLERLGKK